MSSKYQIKDPDGVYFITFATVQWVDVFTRLVYKDIVVNSLKYCQEEKGLELFAWVIMSNHVHLIARAQEGYHMSDILRDLKKYTSKKIIEAIDHPQESRKSWMLWIFKSAGERNPNNENFQFWQQDNHPIQLVSEAMIDQRLNYLHQNPVKAGIVLEPHEYKYSSAINYADGKGLLDVVLI